MIGYQYWSVLPVGMVWTENESLIQLAGNLRGQALLEWKLLDCKDKTTYQAAIKALRERLDPGNQSIEALDF